MMVPTIHLNGSSREDLLERTTEAGRAVGDALDALERAGPNGRDYYPQGDEAFLRANLEHVDRMRRIRSVLEELRELAEAIANA